MGMQEKFIAALDQLSIGSPFSFLIKSISNDIKDPHNHIRIPDEGIVELCSFMEEKHPGIIINSPNYQALHDVITECANRYMNRLNSSPGKSAF